MNDKELIERLVRLSGKMEWIINALAKLTVDLEDMHKRIERLEYERSVQRNERRQHDNR